MLYKSKARIVWLIISVIAALAAVVFGIINLATNVDLYLTISIGLASLFFLCKGLSDYIESKYCARKDQSLMRNMAYGSFIGCVICFGIFILQIITTI